MYRTAVITVSDRSFLGERPDESGPLLVKMLIAAGYSVKCTAVVPDEKPEIEAMLKRFSDEDDVALILTTGGTGFAPRDVTPEATAAVCERMAPGIPEAMRLSSMRITPRGMLSRGVCGISKRCLILNLPGSPKAARENLEAVLPALDHGLAMLRGGQADCAASAE